jgi:PAS domain S-box-containing protein
LGEPIKLFGASVLRFKFDTIVRLVFEGGIWEQKGEKLMNLIVFFDLVTFLTSLVALIILLIGWKCTLERDVKLLIAGLLICTLLYSFCLVLEWSGITSALDPFEDLIGALIPMWWAFLFYAILQQIAGLDLRQSEEKYRSLLDDVIDSSDVGLFILDSDFKIVWINQALERYFGLKREEVIGKNKRQLIQEQIKYNFEDPESFAERVLATYDNNNYVENFECHILSGNKREDRWLEHWSRPIRSGLYSGGRIELYYNITDQRHAEEALQKAHDELELRVEERTRELEVQKNRLRFLSSRLIMAQEQERRRVSRGLHDEMGQALAILKLRLKSIQRGFPEGQSSLKEEFDDTTQHIDQIIENVRRLSKDLSPVILEDLGLSAALKWLIKNFGKQHSIRTSVEIVNIDHLYSQEIQTNLYRIFQEALTNIIKHARAGHVSFVAKKEEKGSVFFLIKDNGKGFDVNEAVAKSIVERGMGLTAMNERAHMMGAILDIQSRPGEGTRITLEISA